MQHLSHPQRQQATQLLTEFQDVFSLSNSKIGRANVTPFDVQLVHSMPIIKILLVRSTNIIGPYTTA